MQYQLLWICHNTPGDSFSLLVRYCLFDHGTYLSPISGLSQSHSIARRTLKLTKSCQTDFSNTLVKESHWMVLLPVVVVIFGNLFQKYIFKWPIIMDAHQICFYDGKVSGKKSGFVWEVTTTFFLGRTNRTNSIWSASKTPDIPQKKNTCSEGKTLYLVSLEDKKPSS